MNILIVKRLRLHTKNLKFRKIKVLIKRLSTAKKNNFYIFLKKKHKVIDLVATFKVLGDKTYVKLNYKKLFKVYKKIKLKTKTFDNLLKLY